MSHAEVTRPVPPDLNSIRLRTLATLALIPLSLGVAACDVQEPFEGEILVPLHAPVGEPLPGLSAEGRERFQAGALAFARQYSEAEGLGPRFNENSCNACHTFPTDGGTGETSIRRISVTREDGSCDPLTELSGGNLRLQVTDLLAAAGGEPERDTSPGTHTAVFTVPFTYGLGMVDAVPQEWIDRRADPSDADGDGISGRVGKDAFGRPARFGRKADVATLADFVDGAFRAEMGITTPQVPDEDQAGNPPGVPEGVDPAADPEVGGDEFQAVVAFLRFLAPPSPGAVDTPEEDEGRRRFGELGCDACHVPALPTGPVGDSGIPAASVGLYSDLLLHDMGPGLEATCTPGAGNTEFRTEPLMGLRYRDRYLHDGRATRVMDAILAHGGEAEAARQAFEALDRLQQEALLKFLGTL